jgi:hypothetical protein
MKLELTTGNCSSIAGMWNGGAETIDRSNCSKLPPKVEEIKVLD